MTKTKSPQRVIWAVDPFERKNETRSHVITALRELSNEGAVVEPVHVLNPDECNIEVNFKPTWLKMFEPYCQKAMKTFLKNIQGVEFAEPKTIIERRPSGSLAIRSLLKYAERTKTDSILVGTHAKSGLSRFFLGSFAETLLLHSRIPVLVVGPHSSVTSSEKRGDPILFSTDFGPSSFPTFRKVIALAKARNADITLFHCLPHPLEPFLQSSVFLLAGGYLAFPDFLSKNEERKNKAALRYIKEAKKNGIHVEVEFNPGHGSTAQAIVSQAEKEKSGLIAMSAQSGPISATLIGSVTRQVVRAAPCPVWVLRAS